MAEVSMLVAWKTIGDLGVTTLVFRHVELDSA